MIKHGILFLWIIFFAQFANAQYLIEGNLKEWESNKEYIAYLSILEEWDDFQKIEKENIVKSTVINTLGYFKFEGNEFSNKIGFYKVHFAPKDNPTLMIGYPKNQVNFLLSNQDSIELSLKSRSFATLLKVSSSIAANLELKNVSSTLDTLRVQAFKTSLKEEAHVLLSKSHAIGEDTFAIKASNSNLLKLLKTKKTEFLLERYHANQDALLRMYCVYFAELKVEAYAELYKDLAQSLKRIDYRKNYHQSLNLFIQANSDKAQSKTISQLYKAVWALSMLVGLLSIGLFIVWKRSPSLQPARKGDIDYLTSKEREIYYLILEQKSNKQIAALLFISHATVKTHINNIYRKLSIKSRKELRYFSENKST